MIRLHLCHLSDPESGPGNFTQKTEMCRIFEHADARCNFIQKLALTSQCSQMWFFCYNPNLKAYKFLLSCDSRVNPVINTDNVGASSKNQLQLCCPEMLGIKELYHRATNVPKIPKNH